MNSNASVLARSHIGNAGLRGLFADLAVLSTAACILGLFAISPIALEHFGIEYITAGGGILSKFHPSTFLALLALTLRCLATRQPLPTAWRLVSGDPGVVILLTAVILAGVYAVLVSKTPVTPLIDTFVLPALCFLLLRDLDTVLIKWLALLVACCLGVNAIMAIIEFLRGVHFVTLPIVEGSSSDPTRGDAVFDWRVEITQDWRATALLGHPLVNGLLTACFIVCLAARGSRWLPAMIKGPLLLLQCASMFAFGARSSLVLIIVVLFGLGLQQAGDALRRGARLTPRVMAISLLVIAVTIGAAEIVAETGFFDRTLDRFANDSGSAATRATMFELFRPFSWSDIMLGPDKDVVSTWQRLYGLEFGIESSWVGLALAYGVLVTGILMVGLLVFTRSVTCAAGRGATLVLGFFLLSVSGTASMSGKTTSFAMAVILVLLFLRKDERQRPLGQALGLEPPPPGTEIIAGTCASRPPMNDRPDRSFRKVYGFSRYFRR